MVPTQFNTFCYYRNWHFLPKIKMVDGISLSPPLYMSCDHTAWNWLAETWLTTIQQWPWSNHAWSTMVISTRKYWTLCDRVLTVSDHVVNHGQITVKMTTVSQHSRPWFDHGRPCFMVTISQGKGSWSITLQVYYSSPCTILLCHRLGHRHLQPI